MPEKINAESEEDLLAFLANRIDEAEICREAMQHPYAKGKVLKLIAEKGPISVLPSLLTKPIIQGTDAQKIGQRRLQEAAESTSSETETSYDSDDYEEDERETGTCDCRWR